MLLYVTTNSSSHCFLVVPDAEIVWCQEEPMNMGAYTYIVPRLYTAMIGIGRGSVEDIKYVGRAPSAATATGFLKKHQNEQADILRLAMQPEPINCPYSSHSN